MTVYAVSPRLPGIVTEIVGPDDKYGRGYSSGAPNHFKVRVRWLGSERSILRSSYGLHDLDARIVDSRRQLEEMMRLRDLLGRTSG